MTQLFGFTMPNPVPAKYLAENSGLKPNAPSYLGIGDNIEFVTQDQEFITKYCWQQFGIPTMPNGIPQIYYGWAEQLWDKSVAARHG